MTKEQVKETYLIPIAEKKSLAWHNTECHKLSVGAWWLDAMGITDGVKRKEMLALWNKTPAAFGTNCSGFAQSLGRVTGEEKTAAMFDGI